MAGPHQKARGCCTVMQAAGAHAKAQAGRGCYTIMQAAGAHAKAQAGRSCCTIMQAAGAHVKAQAGRKPLEVVGGHETCTRTVGSGMVDDAEEDEGESGNVPRGGLG